MSDIGSMFSPRPRTRLRPARGVLGMCLRSSSTSSVERAWETFNQCTSTKQYGSAMPSFKLTPEQIALLPDDNDIAFYEANGYYITKEGAIPESLLDSAYAGIEEFWDGKVDAVLPYETGYVNW